MLGWKQVEEIEDCHPIFAVYEGNTRGRYGIISIRFKSSCLPFCVVQGLNKEIRVHNASTIMDGLNAINKESEEL